MGLFKEWRKAQEENIKLNEQVNKFISIINKLEKEKQLLQITFDETVNNIQHKLNNKIKLLEEDNDRLHFKNKKLKEDKENTSVIDSSLRSSVQQ